MLLLWLQLSKTLTVVTLGGKQLKERVVRHRDSKHIRKRLNITESKTYLFKVRLAVEHSVHWSIAAKLQYTVAVLASKIKQWSSIPSYTKQRRVESGQDAKQQLRQPQNSQGTSRSQRSMNKGRHAHIINQVFKVGRLRKQSHCGHDRKKHVKSYLKHPLWKIKVSAASLSVGYTFFPHTVHFSCLSGFILLIEEQKEQMIPSSTNTSKAKVLLYYCLTKN